MAVTRESLRKRSQAEQDFYSPMTGGTQIRYADAPTPRRDTYGSRVKDRLADIGKGPKRSAPIIEAIKVAVQKTEDPFTKIKEQKSYAPEEESGIGLEGIADAAQGAIDEGVSQVEEYRKGSSQKAAERRAERQAELKAARDERAALRGDMKKLFERDRRMYGNTVPKGSMGSGSKPGPAVDTNVARHSVGGPGDQPDAPKFEKKETRTYRGQGGLKLGSTTQRQGGTVKDGKKVEKSDSPAVKITNYRDIRQKRLDAREAARQAKKVSPAAKATGIPTGKNLKAGSFGISQAGKDQAAINRGIKAAEATGIPTKPPAGSFGISEAGRLQAAKNRAQAQAKAKAQAAKKTSTVSTTTKQGVQRTKAQMAAAKRKASGTTSSQARAANKASMRDAARARHASFKKAKAAGTHARTASAQRARNKAAAKARAKAAAKARNKAKANRGRRGSRKRGRRRCDIMLKFDISLLTNNNLRHDELAEVAYFVRALREVEL
jgi:chemotaxis protein histidine kinase CheA